MLISVCLSVCLCNVQVKEFNNPTSEILSKFSYTTMKSYNIMVYRI